MKCTKCGNKCNYYKIIEGRSFYLGHIVIHGIWWPDKYYYKCKCGYKWIHKIQR